MRHRANAVVQRYLTRSGILGRVCRMDFDLSEEQRAFQATARQFARDEMMPNAHDWDEGEVFPVEALRKEVDILATLRHPNGW